MNGILKNKKGFSLIELLIVISIIGILAAFAVPEYGVYIAKNKAKTLASDLLQTMKMASTMAIKENRTYLITFNEDGSNEYRVGVDINDNGSLKDAVDEYYKDDVRVVNLQSEYGDSIKIGTDNFTTTIPNGPNAISIVNATSASFAPTGGMNVTGEIYIQHTGANRGYTYCIMSATVTSINLFVWDGYAGDTDEVNWTVIR